MKEESPCKVPRSISRKCNVQRRLVCTAGPALGENGDGGAHRRVGGDCSAEAIVFRMQSLKHAPRDTFDAFEQVNHSLSLTRSVSFLRKKSAIEYIVRVAQYMLETPRAFFSSRWVDVRRDVGRV